MQALYEGKAKRLYETDNPNELLMEFKDDATAFNGQKHATFENKGALNKQLSVLLYRVLEGENITTHFVEDRDDTHIVVKRVEIIAIELVVRNYVAGSLQKRTGLDEGHRLRQPIVEFYYKSDALGDPFITEEHVRELGLANPEELAKIRRQSLRVNQVLTRVFEKAGIQLVDFKLEFGRLYPERKNVVLADEISPDTCRLWDLETGKKLDKDRFRADLGEVMESYAEVLSRLENAIAS
ncbi:phosphoribosylaminoimidazolesuccinocarboxamide synthase [soil metagenome]